jgi:hypothetical protein
LRSFVVAPDNSNKYAAPERHLLRTELPTDRAVAGAG